MKSKITAIIVTTLLAACKTEIKQEEQTMEEAIPQQEFYLGTYTDGDSEGIYRYALSQDGMLSKIGLSAKSENPSFLAMTKDGNTLLAVNENEKGSIESYAVKGDSLTRISTSSTEGAHPCFVTVDDKGDVLVANYSSGNVSFFKLDGNRLSPLLFSEQHEGKGKTDRQAGPHAHSAWFLPGTQNQVVSIDLGTNELWFSTIEGDSLVQKSKLQMPEGVGPRHLAFYPGKDWFYVVNELKSSVTLVKKEGDTYSVVNTVSTLPEDFEGESFCADIHISSDGKFVYASNRGHQSIAIFKVQDDGNLESIGFEPVKGEHPRNFALSPGEDFLLVANKNTNNLVSFKRDSATGLLQFIDEIEAPSPVCILFD